MVTARTIWAAALAALLACSQAIIVTVQAHEDECYYEQVDAGNKLMGSFEVLTGGLQDVDATVFGPGGEVHYSVQRQKTGQFTLLAPTTVSFLRCWWAVITY